MNKKASLVPVLLVTFYLLIYTTITYLQVSVGITFLMYAVSPFLIIWMVVSVLKGGEGETKVLELNEKEEWGYQDINKEELGMF
jgi:cytochrome c biogenesis factor